MDAPTPSPKVPSSKELLTGPEIEMLIQSMEFTKQKFKTYPDYPSQEFRQQRVAEADGLIAKLRKMRRAE